MFRFDLTKAIQAAAVLFREEGTEAMEALRLLKLLYVAERESIQEISRPIVGDRIVALEHGPVMSDLYDLVKDEPLHSDQWTEWHQFFESSGRHVVVLTGNPGIGQLSKYEIAKLKDVAQRYRNIDEWKLVDESRQFEEWKQCESVGIRTAPCKTHIAWRSIFEAVGKGGAYDGAVSAMKDEASIDTFFDGAKKLLPRCKT